MPARVCHRLIAPLSLWFALLSLAALSTAHAEPDPPRAAQTKTAPLGLGAVIPPGTLKSWKLIDGGIRVTLDSAVLKTMLDHRAGPEMSKRMPGWVKRGIVWGRTRYRDPEPVIDQVMLRDIGRADAVSVEVEGGVMAERERGSWRWRGLKSGLVWRPQGSARIADMTAHGHLQLELTSDSVLVVTAVLHSVAGRPKLRFLNRVGFTIGLGGREVHTERIPLPTLGFGFALTGVSVVGVDRGDIVLDLAIGPVSTSPAQRDPGE